MRTLSLETQDKLLKAGLVGAGLLTVTWWTACGAGVWLAVSWAMA